MKTVYSIKYDDPNNVIHAITGENSGSRPLGITFDTIKTSFGRVLQKWQLQDLVSF